MPDPLSCKLAQSMARSLAGVGCAQRCRAGTGADTAAARIGTGLSALPLVRGCPEGPVFRAVSRGAFARPCRDPVWRCADCAGLGGGRSLWSGATAGTWPGLPATGHRAFAARAGTGPAQRCSDAVTGLPDPLASRQQGAWGLAFPADRQAVSAPGDRPWRHDGTARERAFRLFLGRHRRIVRLNRTKRIQRILKDS